MQLSQIRCITDVYLHSENGQTHYRPARSFSIGTLVLYSGNRSSKRTASVLPEGCLKLGCSFGTPVPQVQHECPNRKRPQLLGTHYNANLMTTRGGHFTGGTRARRQPGVSRGESFVHAYPSEHPSPFSLLWEHPIMIHVYDF